MRAPSFSAWWRCSSARELRLLEPVVFRRFSGLASRAIIYWLVGGRRRDSPGPKPLSASPFLHDGRPLLRGSKLGAGEVVWAHFAVSGEYVGEAVAKLGEVKVEGARAEAVKAVAWPLKVGGDPRPSSPSDSSPR